MIIHKQHFHLLLFGQERDSGVWESVRMNTHTPKWAPTLGVEVPADSQIFKERLQRSNPIALRSFLYHWKAIETKMSKMGLHETFGHLKHKLWSKERSGIKLAVWLVNQFDSQPQKVGNRPDFLACRWHVTHCWKVVDEGYNFGLDLIPIGGMHKKL
jgi:hypothetical protein